VAGSGASGAAAAQTKVLQLLSELTATAEGGAGTAAGSRAMKRRAAAQLLQPQHSMIREAGARGGAAAVDGGAAGAEVAHAAELQQLAIQRRLQLQQYRAAKKA
jgi:hypothetical protein